MLLIRDEQTQQDCDLSIIAPIFIYFNILASDKTVPSSIYFKLGFDS